MMERKFKFAIDEYYHIYNRGVEKRVIFKDKNDYSRFVKILYALNNKEPITMEKIFKENRGKNIFLTKRKGDPLVNIGAYCLMPNHFHLLLKEVEEGGISKFLNKIQTSHSMFFNLKYKRRGRLFEGTFKAQHIDSESYYQYLISYIHLNPVKVRFPEWESEENSNIDEIKKSLDAHSFSSYYDFFVGERPESNLLDRKEFPDFEESDIDLLVMDYKKRREELEKEPVDN